MWRRASEADDASIVALCVALMTEDPAAEPVPPAHTERTLRTFRAEPWRGCAVVLELHGMVAGYALLASFWSNELGGEICTVDELYVVPSHRGHGHATSLLQALAAPEQTLWPRRPTLLGLEVTPDN